MRTIKILILCLPLFSISCSTEPKANQLSEAPTITTVIPFELVDNRIFVDVFIENKGPFKFIFDTGSTNVLTPAIAQKLNLNTQRDTDGTGAGEKTFRVDQAKVKDLKIGDIHLTNQDFSVIDMSDIQKAFRMPAFDGTFGYEVLLQYLALIDFEKNQLTLTNAQSAFDESKYAKIPFKLQFDKPVIEAQIDDLTAKVLIDTGDRSSLTVFKNFRDQHSKIAKVYQQSKEQVTGFGAGGPIPAKLGYISSLEVAPGVSMKKVISRAPTTLKGFNALKDMNASIGNEVLTQFNVVFDYKNKYVYLEKNKRFGTPTKFTEVPNPTLK